MSNTPPSSPVVLLPPDYHTHTRLCKHATGTPQEFRQQAQSLGLAELCFTDHCPEPSGYDPLYRMTLAELPDYYELIRPLQEEGTPPVLLGLEADFFPGCEGFLSPFLPAQPLDLVMGSVHYIKNWGFDNPNYLTTWASADLKGVWVEYFKLIRQLVDTRLFDVISHFDLPKKFGHRLRDRDLKELVQPLLDHIAKAGMAFEINTSGWRRPAAECYPSPLILSLAAEREIPITFGSDAHAPDEVGFRFTEALALALETGCKTSLCFKNRVATRVPLSTWRR
jgi:histidinol-phosphatase (PHP family)